MSTIMTGEAVPLQVRPAALIRRAGSCVIDVIAVQTVFLASYFLGAWVLERAFDYNPMLFGSMALILQVICAVLIPCAIETLTRGRSLGKLCLGLRIVRVDGGAIRFRHAFLRAMAWMFEVIGTGGALAATVGLVSPDSKRIGDYLAGTIAIPVRAPKVRPRAVLMPPRLARWAESADISTVPPGLHHRVQQFLVSAPRMSDSARLRMAVELADQVSVHAAPLPPAGTHPEEFLAGVSASLQGREWQRRQTTAQLGARFRERSQRLPHHLQDMLPR